MSFEDVMSLIAYDRGFLLGDTFAIYDYVPSPVTTPTIRIVKKVHVDVSEMFAFAYCGETLLSRQVEHLKDIFRGVLTNYYLSGAEGLLSFKNVDLDFLHERQILLATKDRLFSVEDPKRMELDMTTVHVFGSYSGTYLITRQLYDPVKAAMVSLTIILQRDNLPVDVVDLNALKPFTVTVGSP